jgi:Tfp pilus assembly ATPase PilU
LPSHAPSNLVAEGHLQDLIVYSRGVICLYNDVCSNKSSSAARLFDTSSFMMTVHIIINGRPTSGLAIHR